MEKNVKRVFIILLLFQVSLIQYGQIIIDHNTTKLQDIPLTWINQAKSSLHIAYEHTSHGSQIIDGMTGLYNWKGSTFAWNDGGSGGALDIDDYGITGGSDLGSPDWTSWAVSTRAYLNNPANSRINIVMWSWCSQVSTASESNINTYLNLMSALERDYPRVRFVYMTGHLDGTGITGNLHLRNQQIRSYCRNNNKILYDFADIESYNPDGSYFLDRAADANCDYDSDGNGSRDRNWAVEWQSSHTLNVDWYNCNSRHSQPLNANLKAYAAWWLWARLAGWTGTASVVPVSGITVSGAGGANTITSLNGTLQLSAVVTPSDASDRSVTWSITNGTGRATISTTGLVTAAGNGTVTARATAKDGTDIYGTLVLTISGQEVPVENITVRSENGSNVISESKGTLQLSAQVIPQSASSKAVSWSVENITGRATVNSSGLVIALDEGTVKVIASATDGSGIKGYIDITIVKPESLVVIVKENEMRVLFDEDYTSSKLSLYSLQGTLLRRIIVDGYECVFETSHYRPGIYILILSNTAIIKAGKVIIP